MIKSNIQISSSHDNIANCIATFFDTYCNKIYLDPARKLRVFFTQPLFNIAKYEVILYCFARGLVGYSNQGMITN